MKICPKCGADNPNTATFCSECLFPFIDTKPTIETDSEIFFRQEEKRQRHRKTLALLVIPIYYIVYISFSIKYIMDGSWFCALLFPLIFPILYYLMMFKADCLFKLEHILDIDNIDNVNISDWYYMGNKIGAALLIIMGLALITAPCLPFWSL